MDILKIGFAIVVIVLAIFAAGCVGPHSTPAPTPTLVPSTQVPEPPRNDNAIFMQLMEEMDNDVARYLNDLGTKMIDGNYLEARTSAARLESLADVYMEDISECVVTEDVEPIKVLVLKSLEEIRLGALHCQVGLHPVDTDELDKGVLHFKIALGYLGTVDEMYKE